jgi:hypothetical protein
MPTPKRTRDAVASALWPASLQPATFQMIEDAQALGVEVPEHTPGFAHKSKQRRRAAEQKLYAYLRAQLAKHAPANKRKAPRSSALLESERDAAALNQSWLAEPRHDFQAAVVVVGNGLVVRGTDKRPYVQRPDGTTAALKVVKGMKGKWFSYHLPETLTGCERLAPDEAGAELQLVAAHVRVGDQLALHGRTVARLRVLFVRCGAAWPRAPDRRSAHLVYELADGLVEVVTSRPGWMAIVVGCYANDVHSTPWIQSEVNAARCRAATVVKAVAYTQRDAATLLANRGYSSASTNRAAVETAKAVEFAALGTLDAAGDDSVLAAARALGTCYAEAAARGELVDDECVNALYWPLGWAIRGEKQRRGANYNRVNMPFESKTWPYLRLTTYDNKQKQVLPLAGKALAALGVVLGAASRSLACAMPEVLVHAYDAVGGPGWGSKFAAVPMHLQAVGRGASGTDAPAAQGLSCTQVGVRMSPGPGDVYEPTARHRDKHDFKSKGHAVQAQSCGRAVIVYVSV